MTRNKKSHKFPNKLILNQWLISLFGIDPLQDHFEGDQLVRPFHKLKKVFGDDAREGLNYNGLHYFHEDLLRASFFREEKAPLSAAEIIGYEENISRHTRRLNEKRERKIRWKYYQWLGLLFTEIYLDRYFRDRAQLLAELNEFVDRFNGKWPKYKDFPHYKEEDLNKVCFQMATGSGKTLIMHVNLYQFQHYAEASQEAEKLSRSILITPNERLSDQHIEEYRMSRIPAAHFAKEGFSLFTQARGLQRVDVIEISKLGDEEKKQTIETRSLGDTNLLFVDEGHRGASSSGDAGELGSWMQRRQQLAEKGFTFEYSATFQQAVAGASEEIQDGYAGNILFDYSYRWFYEDGYGKDYKIDNLPNPDEATIKRLRSRGNSVAASRLEAEADLAEALMPAYLTAALLKFYQQLRLYEEKFSSESGDIRRFNLEKPLWVFVGSSVTSGHGSKENMSDVAKILEFFADFLGDPNNYSRIIEEILTGTGTETGLINENGQDIFEGAFSYLNDQVAKNGESSEQIYRHILNRFFHNRGGGKLHLERITGDSGEVLLRVGQGEKYFGLINVGDAKKLCDHLEEAVPEDSNISITTSEFSEGRFDEVKESSSSFNLLLGSRKFIEGWNCWRVSSLGLMNVGKSEGTQIIQLFGRGVRLKGYDWGLKRSGHARLVGSPPSHIEELETLNVFGIDATYMEEFKKVLEDEGLPGNEERVRIEVPITVTYDFGKKLKIVRPKTKPDGGGIYEFKKDGPAPNLEGSIPEYLKRNRVVVDYYPRIQSITSKSRSGEVEKEQGQLQQKHRQVLDYDALYFELERYKAERAWYNFNITKEGIRRVLEDSTWYELFIPGDQLGLRSFSDIRRIQRIASELLKRYADRLYNYQKRAFIEPRLEVQELKSADANIPKEGEQYIFTVDGNERELVQQVRQFAAQMDSEDPPVAQFQFIHSLNFQSHLFKPLLHVKQRRGLSIRPVPLNKSEFEFVEALKEWSERKAAKLDAQKMELYLLRNLSRGKGVGFFEAGGFHPDFIMWLVREGKQYVTFIDPHGLQHTGAGNQQVQFSRAIKDVEKRLKDPGIVLNSFILSPTRYEDLRWQETKVELQELHVLFMQDEEYLDQLFARLGVFEKQLVAEPVV